ncbi:MAG TPA: hypothetical protein VIY54_13160 [Steroidobacteraceae bacterium]
MADRLVGHESSAVAVPRILGVGAVLAVTVIVVVVVIHGVLRHWVTPEHSLVVARTAAIPPPPRLQPHPDEELAGLRAQKRAKLSSWAWMDESHGFARIPIDRAMALYVRQHAAATRPAVAAPRPQSATP